MENRIHIIGESRGDQTGHVPLFDFGDFTELSPMKPNYTLKPYKSTIMIKKLWKSGKSEEKSKHR